MYDMDSLDLISSNRLSKLPDSLNRSFCDRLVVEIVPCNSDIGDIGKFKRCDLDRIMTNEKDDKNSFAKIFCPDIQIFSIRGYA